MIGFIRLTGFSYYVTHYYQLVIDNFRQMTFSTDIFIPSGIIRIVIRSSFESANTYITILQTPVFALLGIKQRSSSNLAFKAKPERRLPVTGVFFMN